MIAKIRANFLVILLSVCLTSVAINSLYAAGRSISISPKYEPGTIIVQTKKRKLLFIEERGKAIQYPVAVGKPSEQWYGLVRVVNKRKNPRWTPTPSMRRKNPNLPRFVPGGPGNPLGKRAIYLNRGAYRIHGTNKPSSIGYAASSGCFRMYNKDVVELYERVTLGAPVIITK